MRFMKKSKIVISILAVTLLIVLLCNYNITATYKTEYERGTDGFARYEHWYYTCTKVDYDFHVEYGEVVNIWFSMVRNPKDPYSKWLADEALTISMLDGEHYDVVGNSVYVIDDFYDDKYEMQEGKNQYPINVHFAIKITDPSFEEERVKIEIKSRHLPEEAWKHGWGLDCDENGWYVDQFSVLRFISDEKGIVVYYSTGKNGDWKKNILRSF